MRDLSQYTWQSVDEHPAGRAIADALFPHVPETCPVCGQRVAWVATTMVVVGEPVTAPSQPEHLRTFVNFTVWVRSVCAHWQAEQPLRELVPEAAPVLFDITQAIALRTLGIERPRPGRPQPGALRADGPHPRTDMRGPQQSPRMPLLTASREVATELRIHDTYEGDRAGAHTVVIGHGTPLATQVLLHVTDTPSPGWRLR